MSYIVLSIPTVSAENYFTQDVVLFLLLWVVLAASLLLCIQGYRYFQALAVMILGAIAGGFCMEMLGNAPQPILQMVLFLFFTMAAMCLFYVLTCLIKGLLDRLHLRKFLAAGMPVLTAILGGAMAAALVYTKIYAFAPVAVGLFLVLAVGGSIHQIHSRRKTPEFHTYADLLRLPLRTEEDIRHE